MHLEITQPDVAGQRIGWRFARIFEMQWRCVVIESGYFTDAEQHRINEGDEKFIPEYFVHYLMSAVHGSVVDPPYSTPEIPRWLAL